MFIVLITVRCGEYSKFESVDLIIESTDDLARVENKKPVRVSHLLRKGS